MQACRTAPAVLVAVLLAGPVAADELRSGPQVGDEVPGSFRPLNVNGPAAGERSCLYCRHGLNPVAMVFAKRPTAAVEELVRRLDAAAAEHAAAKLGAFAVFLGNRERLEKELSALDDRLKLRHLVLAVDAPTGPEKYAVSGEAEVTVVLYVGGTVRANHAFRKGEFDEKAVARVLADLPKVLPGK
jgi:hypothetical protein